MKNNRLAGLACITLSCLIITAGCASMGAISIPVDRLKEKYGTEADRYMAYRGMQVRYRDEGSGPVLVLLHGVCSSLETWDGWKRNLGENYRIIRIDIPGFGMTGPAPDKSQYTREQAVAFLNDFMGLLGVEKFSLAGNSLGGYIAWNYALDYPDRVTRLILIDPVGYNQKLPGLLALASNPVMRPSARSMMPRGLLKKAVYQVYGDKSKVTPAVVERYYDFAMREGNKRSYVDVFAEIRRQNDSPDLSNAIPNISVPTLVMWGTKDEWIPFTYFESWRRDLPSARFIAYEGAGHVPMEELPEKTSADAKRFLEGAAGRNDAAAK